MHSVPVIKIKSDLIVGADWHIGSANFLPSVLENLLARALDVAEDPDLAVIGDAVTGSGIFPRQEAQSLPPEFQVLACASYLSSVPVRRVLILDGNHDYANGHPLSRELALTLEALGKKAVYLSQLGMVLVGGERVLLLHGHGSSRYSPHPPALLTNLSQLLLALNVKVDRVCHGHTHWGSLNFPWGGIYVDSVGGLEKATSPRYLAQRMPSLIVYRRNGQHVQILPDREVLQEGLSGDRRAKAFSFVAKHAQEALDILTHSRKGDRIGK